MRKTILYPVLLLTLAACQNSSTEKQVVEDSSVHGEIILNELDTLKAISRSFAEIDSTFDMASFEQAGFSPCTSNGCYSYCTGTASAIYALSYLQCRQHTGNRPLLL